MQNKIDDPEWLSHLCWWMVDPEIYGGDYYRVKFQVVCVFFLYNTKKPLCFAENLQTV